MMNTRSSNQTNRIHGAVSKAFEEVKTEFIRNFKERGEIGASCCIYYKGEKVVDLWGGYKNNKTKEFWEENTVVKVFSTSKGMALLVLAKLHSEGLIDYNEKVSTYWPEFGKNGKNNITVEQLLTHKSGLVLLDRKVKVSELNNFDELSVLLENATPMWTPGTKHGYHSATIGLFIQQLVRRIDKQNRSIGHYFSDEIAKVLDADFYIGLPTDFNKNRLATVKELVPPLALFQLKKVPKGMLRQLINPGSLMMKSFSLIKIDLKDPLDELKFEEASGAGVGEARALANIYGDLANGGKTLGIKPETFKYLVDRTIAPTEGTLDEVMRIKTVGNSVKWSRSGHCKPSDDFNYGPESAFGFYGTGGSFAFADPENKIGFAYTMNKMDFYTQNDPREIALREAMYNSIFKINQSTHNHGN